jgi:glutamate 5-kinase
MKETREHVARQGQGGEYSGFLRSLSHHIEAKERLRYRRIVIKIGSNLIAKNGGINEELLRNLSEEIIAFGERGGEALLVTSGAVAVGREIATAQGLHTTGQEEGTEHKQMLAAIGQPNLISFYQTLFGLKGKTGGQILLQKQNFEDEKSLRTVTGAMEYMLRQGVLPIINENDATAVEELLFTDNDELAGLLAREMSADAVVTLTSVDGVLDGTGKRVARISLEDAAEVEKHISDEKTSTGRGGMHTKFAVARRLAAEGIAVHIVNGREDNIIAKVMNGEDVGTEFVAQAV